MSEQFAEAAAAAQEPEAVELPHDSLSAFGVLMDALAPEEDESAADEGAEATGAAGSGEAAGAATGEAAVGDAGNADGAGVGPEGQTGDGGDAGSGAGVADTPGGDGALPATWTVDPSEVVPKFGDLATALEENTAKAFQAESLTEVKEEYSNYFDALNKHPRLLVGTQVPAIGKEGMETLRDSADAREWQDAVKEILVEEVKDRAQRAMEEKGDFLSTVHASIDLFKNNVDLIPGTKGFNLQLATEFAELAAPYELRVDGKLQGYSVPVQPLINQLRTRLASRPVAAAAAAPAPKPAKPAEPPQAGIASRAGNSANQPEDFSTLFGAIGLPTLRI